MRVLIGSSGGSGHVGPLLPVVRALLRRGDDVLAAAPPTAADRLAAAGVETVILDDPAVEETTALWQRVRVSAPAEAAVLVNRDLFGRLNTAARLGAYEDLIRQRRPDLVIHEAAEFAPAIAAHRSRVPHAQVAIGLAEVEASSLRLAAPVLVDFDEKVVDAITASPYLTHLPPRFDPSPYPDTRRFRRADAAPTDPPPWWTSARGPLVYATLGTVVSALSEGRSTFTAMIDALGALPVQALVTVGNDNDPGLWSARDNIHIDRWVDTATVLPHAAVVVCHGGSGTVFDALAGGIPVVAMPFMADQPDNAALVTAAGAGITIDRQRPDLVAALRDAVSAALTQASYQTSARAIGRELRQAPPLDDVLSTLLVAVTHRRCPGPMQ